MRRRPDIGAGHGSRHTAGACRWTHRAAVAMVALCIGLLALISLGAGVGRFQIRPVDVARPGVGEDTSSVAFVVPVPTERLHIGDVVVARVDHEPSDALYRVTAIDASTHDVFALDAHHNVVRLKLGPRAGRVADFVPYVGAVYRLVAGTVQGLVLLVVAMFLLTKAALQRRLRDVEGVRRERFNAQWWITRLAAAVVWAVGAFSVTASATFTATATVNEAGISSGHMQLTVPGAGATNRLTLGASGIAPGDTMQRALDLSVDSTTTTGIMTGINLTITASPSSTLDTDGSDGLKIWIAKCSQAWTESGSTPAYTDTCGGSQTDVLATSGSPTAVSGVSSTSLSNVSTSANSTMHLMIELTFPLTAGDSFQDKSSTLTFAFSGVQRAGTDQ